jgi:TRAP-type C4-dicarboxylate transport system permease small subunit
MGRMLKWLEVPMTLTLWVAMAAGAAMMLHVVVDVTARTFLNRPLQGTSEVVIYYYMVTLCVLPWLALARSDGHIKVDVLTQLLPRAVRFWLDLAMKVVLAGYLGLFTWQTWLHALRQMGRGEVQQAGALYLVTWPTRFLLPLAGGLVVLWLVLHVIHAAGRRLQGRA